MDRVGQGQRGRFAELDGAPGRRSLAGVEEVDVEGVLGRGVLGVLRLVVNLLEAAPARSVAYQVVLLTLNGLALLLVITRLRSLRRR